MEAHGTGWGDFGCECGAIVDSPGAGQVLRFEKDVSGVGAIAAPSYVRPFGASLG